MYILLASGLSQCALIKEYICISRPERAIGGNSNWMKLEVQGQQTFRLHTCLRYRQARSAVQLTLCIEIPMPHHYSSTQLPVCTCYVVARLYSGILLGQKGLHHVTTRFNAETPAQILTLCQRAKLTVYGQS